MSEVKEKVKKPFYKRWWVWVIAGFLVVMALSGGGKDNSSQTAQTSSSTQKSAPSEQKQEPAADDKFIKAGMYKVGTDLPAGEYLLYPEGAGYFQVTKDSTGNFDSIITNDNFSGTRYLTVSNGQYLDFRNAKMIPVSKAEVQKPQNNVYPGYV